jgi:hypothetical protein
MGRMLSTLWALRVALLVAVGVDLLIGYVILGALGPSAFAFGSLMVLALIAAFWAFLELTMQRGVTLQADGVRFRYPLGDRFVPWDRLRPSTAREPAWLDSVAFLEVNARGLTVRAHRVTRSDAASILGRIPS